MGTTQTSTNSINYNPASMQQYQSFWGMASPLLNSLIQNPYNNSSYNLNLAQATSAARKGGTQNMQNALSNFQNSGGNLSGGVGAALMSQLGRYGTNLNYQGFLGAANQAQSDKWNALGIQANRSPLVMGSKTVQQTGGLGSWLPQLAGAALGGLTAAATGGASGMSGLNSQAGSVLSSPSSISSSPFMNGANNPFTMLPPAGQGGPTPMGI